MKVTVRLFARARDLARRDALVVETPDDATVGELRRLVAAACPALADLLPRCAIAIDAEFAGDEQVLHMGAEAAVLPPVSGGSSAC